MSFLKIGDRAAGAIKSGGTTRRAAKMVDLDLDHPDIEEFVNWKVVEEQKVAALVAGSRMLNRHLNAVIEATRRRREGDEPLRSRARTRRSRQAMRDARAAPACPTTTSSARSSSRAQGVHELRIDEYDTDWNSKAYYTVSGQNTNNSVRITNALHARGREGRRVAALLAHGARGGREAGRAPKPCKTLQARDLWDQICDAAWACADPGVQFDTTINEWHTCPADGRINASATRAREYMFLDDTACNLASLNLLQFDDARSGIRRRGATATPSGSGRSCSRSPSHGAVPERARSPSAATTTARSASATPTSARCSWSRASRTTRPRPSRCAAR